MSSEQLVSNQSATLLIKGDSWSWSTHQLLHIGPPIRDTYTHDSGSLSHIQLNVFEVTHVVTKVLDSHMYMCSLGQKYLRYLILLSNGLGTLLMLSLNVIKGQLASLLWRYHKKLCMLIHITTRHVACRQSMGTHNTHERWLFSPDVRVL